MAYDNTAAGCYILLIENNNIRQIILVSEGSFSLVEQDSTFELNFDLKTRDDKTYRATYVGTLQ